MAYFDSEDNVRSYERLAQSMDSSALRSEFLRRVPAGGRVLELGMGPGHDLDALASSGLRVVGSDSSSVFVRRYRERGGEQEVVVLDATNITCGGDFDAVYSNKVLQHLTRQDFARSLERQRDLLEPEGLLFHSLWRGDRTEEHHGMRFTYWDLERLAGHLPRGLELEASGRYCEIWEEDSVWFALRRTAVTSS